MILVTGGAGYIGSHYVMYALQQGEQVLVLDNLVHGHREAVPEGVELVVGDTSNMQLLNALFQQHPIDAVVHFAAFCYVGESVSQPARYFANNTCAALNLLTAMHAANIRYFVFSSTCATYGDPLYMPLDEKHPQNPINPYGESKLFVEKILRRFDLAYGTRYVALRYFNAAGADPQGLIGESHDPETHLIPLVLQVATGQRDLVKVFGADYETPDGTCVRDYVHVLDLAQAHNLALQRLRSGGSSDAFNLGSESGNSVLDVIHTCEKVTGRSIPTEITGRRPGDPPRLVASSAYAQQTLGWKPKYTRLDEIVQTAWNWEQHRRY